MYSYNSISEIAKKIKIIINIDKIASEILYKRDIEMWDWPNCSEDYWLFMITPSGKIVRPNETTHGEHPFMSQYLIYPKDKILELLYKYFEPKNCWYNNIIMSAFQVYYGYINIDGYKYDGTITVKYNPEALTKKTRLIIEALSLRKKIKFELTTDKEISTLKEIIRSKKVAFFRNKIISILKNAGFSDIDEYFEAKGINSEELLANIESQWLKLIEEEKLEGR